MKYVYLSILVLASLGYKIFTNSETETPKFEINNNDDAVVTRTVNMDDIRAIGLSISANVTIRQGNSQQIEITGDEDIIDDLNLEEDNGSWDIKFKDKNSKHRNYDRLEIHVTMKELKALAIGGSGNIKGENKFDVDGKLALAIGGSGNIELDVDADEIASSVGGSGNMTLSGSADDMKISIGGSGDVHAIDLKVETCKVAIGGSGNVEIEVTENLVASIGGSGDIKYKGNPKIKNATSGSGKIRPY